MTFTSRRPDSVAVKNDHLSARTPACRHHRAAGSGGRAVGRPRGGAAYRCGERCGRRAAVAVVRRGGDDLGRHPICARTVADAGPYRRRPRPVLPADARLVRGLSGHRVPLTPIEFHRGRDCRGRGSGAGQAAVDAARCTDRRTGVRDPPAGHLGRYGDPVLRPDDGRRGLADGVLRAGGAARPDRMVVRLRLPGGGCDGAQRLRSVDGAGSRGCGGGVRPAARTAALGGGGGGGHCDDGAVPDVHPVAVVPGALDLATECRHRRHDPPGPVFRPGLAVRRPRRSGAVRGRSAWSAVAAGGTDAHLDRSPHRGTAGVFSGAPPDLLPALPVVHHTRGGTAARNVCRRGCAIPRGNGGHPCRGDRRRSTQLPRPARPLCQGTYGLQPGRRCHRALRRPRRLSGGGQLNDVEAGPDPPAAGRSSGGLSEAARLRPGPHRDTAKHAVGQPYRDLGLG